MSAVTFFTDRVRAAVSQQAGEALAADLRIDSSTDLPDGVRIAAERHRPRTADVVSLRSVVVAGQTTSLADVRGVTAAYPLRGEVRVADRLGGVPQPATGTPRRGEVWAEPSLLARLGVAVGDELEVGTLRLRVTHTLEFRPDEGWRFTEIAPTVLLSLDDVLASGLLAPGSISRRAALYAGGSEALESFRAEIAPLLATAGQNRGLSRRPARSACGDWQCGAVPRARGARQRAARRRGRGDGGAAVRRAAARMPLP